MHSLEKIKAMNAKKKPVWSFRDTQTILKHSEYAYAVVVRCGSDMSDWFIGANVDDPERTQGPLLFHDDKSAKADAVLWDETSDATVVKVRVIVEEIVG